MDRRLGGANEGAWAWGEGQSVSCEAVPHHEYPVLIHNMLSVECARTYTSLRVPSGGGVRDSVFNTCLHRVVAACTAMCGHPLTLCAVRDLPMSRLSMSTSRGTCCNGTLCLELAV